MCLSVECCSRVEESGEGPCALASPGPGKVHSSHLPAVARSCPTLVRFAISLCSSAHPFPIPYHHHDHHHHPRSYTHSLAGALLARPSRRLRLDLREPWSPAWSHREDRSSRIAAEPACTAPHCTAQRIAHTSPQRSTRLRIPSARHRPDPSTSTRTTPANGAATARTNTALMASSRPSLSITLPASFEFHYSDDSHMPKTPEAQQDEQQSAVEPPPPPRPQPFKVKRKRVSSAPLAQSDIMPDSTVIPTIEMSEVPADVSSPTIQPTSAHLLSPVPMSASLGRALTPPKTPAPKLHPTFSQLESPAQEWDLITTTRPSFERAGSVCSSFSDSSVSSYGSSDFSLPAGGYDSPASEAPDPFTDDFSRKHHSQPTLLQSPMLQDSAPQPKRVKTRRDVKWTPQMDDHLWITFMSYLSDPTMTPFKMLPGSTPPMGVCDQVSSKAKRTWRPRKTLPVTPGSVDTLYETNDRKREGSPDTIRPSSLQTVQPKWPKVAATRRRLRELCARRPSISAHYQRMLRTRSPSPFETSSPGSQQPESASAFSGLDMVMSLVTSTAPSMQPDGMLAQLTSDNTPPPPPQRSQRPSRPEGWFDRIPRSKAHQKSASLQSELKLGIHDTASHNTDSLASPFDVDPSSSRSHLLQSMAQTKSLGRTEFNGRSLDSPVEFKVGGAPTDRRSRKRRFRSDEEKPRRPPLEDVFGPPVQSGIVRNRGFSVGAVRATDSLTRLFTPPSIHVDHVMGDASEGSSTLEEVPMGSRSAPRRLAEPVPRLGSPFVETPPQSRQHHTFPRSSLIPSMANQEPFQQRLRELTSHRPSNFGAEQ